MKYFKLFLALLIFIGQSYECFAGASVSKKPKLTGGEIPLFSRTFRPNNPAHQAYRMVVKRKEFQRSTSNVVITYEDLKDHLALDKTRSSVIAEPLSGQVISMDVGNIDPDGETPQIWVMPDLLSFETTSEFITHTDWESTGLTKGYTEQTHAFYIPGGDYYEFHELNQDELFFLGYGKVENANKVTFEDFYLTMAPLLLEWGLDYEGTVVEIFDEDPDYDSIVYVQHYEVVAEGTLQTYDDGAVDAVKLNFTETVTGYKDGQEVDVEEYSEIVWYSEEGHYLRGLLQENASYTGVTSFDQMSYQKISTTVSTTDENYTHQKFTLTSNPVSAGEVLTISNDLDIQFGLIRLYDMQGRLVQQLDMSGMGAVHHFQIQIPSELMAGMYTYRMSSPSGKPLGHSKLNIH